MDIDTTHKLCSILIKECYQYRDPNHVVCECSVRLDMCQLTTKQWEKLIENLNILKDIKIKCYLEPDITDIANSSDSILETQNLV